MPVVANNDDAVGKADPVVDSDRSSALTCGFVVAGTGVDPVTSRFSGARSAN
jgi:hypothetical protein